MRELAQGGYPTLIHGAARGADQIAARWAKTLGWHVEAYPADWNRYGRRAGPLRNAKMIAEAESDICIAFPLPDSVGTRDCIRRANAAGIPVRIYPPA